MIDIFAEAFKANSALNSMANTKNAMKESMAKKLTSNEPKTKTENTSKVAYNKIKFTEDVSAVEPQDDIMVVYSDAISDEMTEEEIEEAAQDLIGQEICKCGICGANYVCSCEQDSTEKLVIADEDDFEEDLSESILFSEEVEEDTGDITTDEVDIECPVCGADKNQIVVGEIAPIETNDDESEDVVTANEPKENDIEDAEDITVDTEVVDALDNDNTAETATVEADAEEVEESCQLTKEGKRGPKAGARYTTLDDPNPDPRFEVSSNIDGVIANVSSEFEAKKTIASLKRDDRKIPSRKNKDIEYTYKELRPAKPRVEPKEPEYLNDYDDDYDHDKEFYELDEHSANRVFTKFARENFENVASVRFINGKLVNGEVVLEGIVKTVRGNRRPITITSVGFKCNESTKKIKVIEKGPFTESATVANGKVPFVVECVIKGKTITFTGMKYNYIVKESKDSYSVSGIIKLAENVKRNIKK